MRPRRPSRHRVAPSSRGLRLIGAASFLRAVATGFVAIVLGLYLARLNFAPGAIGGVVSAGLAGSAIASALAIFGDRFGRGRYLLILTLMSAVGAALLASVRAPAFAFPAAFIGMINGMGRDRGPFAIVDQTLVADLASDRDRTGAFARYHVLQDAGHALGALLAGLPVWFAGWAKQPDITSYRWAMGLYIGLILLMGALYTAVPAASREDRSPRRLAISATTRGRLWRIGPLFALDSLGGGFLTAAMVAYFLNVRFGANLAFIGALYAAGRIANAASHLGAAWLARRIGLVNTMVFTHLPSSLLLVGMALAPSLPVAAALFLLRESLVEMDVPTRQSYVMAVVAPEERSFVAAITGLVRQGGWAVAPAFAGLATSGLSPGAPLIFGAALKITYDVLLFFAFRGVAPAGEPRAAIGGPEHAES